MKKTPNQRTYRGGCHCGRVRFEVRGMLERVSECNCSICTKKGYVHWIVERAAFRLLTPSDNIAAYTFNTKVAKHLFCPNCGVASFYIPRSDPESIDVNVRCLEGVNLGQAGARNLRRAQLGEGLSGARARPSREVTLDSD